MREGEKGIEVVEARTISDNDSVIINTVNHFRVNVDYVFTTGGIGPTHDDITAECVAKAFGVQFQPHPQAVAILKQYYKPEDLNPARLSMADMPLGAILIPNPVTAAPGVYMGNVFVMAGVPSIMQAMFDNVLDILTPGQQIHSQTITTMLPEGRLAETLSIIQDQYPQVKIGSYPHFREQKRGVSIVLRSFDEKLLHLVAEFMVQKLDKLSDENNSSNT